jgi:hypothetical protein
MSMHRKVANLRIFPKDGLSAIAVMHVPIHDEDAFDSPFAGSYAGTDGNMIEKTESHGVVGHRMMTRRPNQAKRIGGFSLDDALGSIANCSGRKESYLVGMTAHDRVLIERTTTVEGELLDGANIIARMNVL